MAVEGDGVVIVGIGPAVDGVAGEAAGVSAHQELPVRAVAIVIAPGHVRHIALPVFHADHIPHVSSAGVPGDGDAADVVVKRAEIAKVLEGLGIALTDHVRRGIPVKDPDDLPGVAGADAALIALLRGIVIVVDEAADLQPVTLQLLPVALAGIGGHNVPGLLGGGGHRGADGGVHGGVVAVGILRHDIEGNGDGVKLHPVLIAVDGETAGAESHALGFVRPIERIGMIVGDGRIQAVEAELLIAFIPEGVPESVYSVPVFI